MTKIFMPTGDETSDAGRTLFGTASVRFDNQDHQADFRDHADWALNSNDFTIEMWFHDKNL